MDVAATTAAATTAKSDTTGIGRARLAENFDTFLSLLTTQLKNQDPLSPMDSN
jgi:flagellar basal-body rod modification protein FlgD